jgi:hypothetical protein
MNKIIDELISIESDEKNIFIKIPIDLLVFAQENRESPYFIGDKIAMMDYFKKYFLNFNQRQCSDIGSDFEILLDDFFDWSFEMAEAWLTSPEFDGE